MMQCACVTHEASLQDRPQPGKKRKIVSATPAILLAAKSGRRSEVIGAILGGGDVNGCDFAGLSPLHYAARRDEKGIVQALLQHGAAADACPPHGLTPLHCAAENDAAASALLLLKHNAPVDKREEGVHRRRGVNDMDACMLGLTPKQCNTLNDSGSF
eukprot:m.27209 g.27209  ORF g.27209 m.27209 type:complete len:158 (+) comp13408_c0_seq2:319-792(+)